jgi:hypothetical protein
MRRLKRKEMVVMFSRSIRLSLASLAAIVVLSGCGDGGNIVGLGPQLDTTPPPAPQNLTVANDAYGWPVLAWTESAAPDVIGYQVYVYSALPGGGNDYVPADDAISVDPSFRLVAVASDAVASYRVRAVDAAGNWSAFSAAVDVQAPGGSGGTDPYEVQ